ncbi:464_t:CDS:2, partial [Paraglomus occultum]
MKDINTKKRKIKYEGELDLAGHKLYCYVLEDGERGFSTRSTQEVLGIVDKDGKQKWSANRLGKFLSQKSLQPTFTEEKGLIYENLPEGVLEKIKEKTPKTKGGHWRYKFHQSLTPEVGKEHLKKVIYTVEALAKISKDKNQFLRLVKKVYHPKKDLSSYIDIEAMDDSKETKVDKVLGALLKTPKPKK